jgi:NADPH-dependent curcumin reductase CurA
MTTNTKILLKTKCEGLPEESDFEKTKEEIIEPKEGQIKCESLYLSLDPYLRGKINGRHISGAIFPGELMTGEVISRVTSSADPAFKKGDLIISHSGWQSHPVINAADASKIIDLGIPVSTYLGILGMPGLTAYAGLLRLAKPKEKDVVLVSAASGAVGSMVGQIAKIKNCYVVGIAGSDEKCSWVTKTTSMDECINYKKENLTEKIKEYCPQGIDIYYDNVGAETLQAAMEQLAPYSRVILCGLMSQYNSDSMPAGPNPAWIIKARAIVKGMVVYDHEDMRVDFLSDVSKWIKEERIHYLEDITEGLANAPAAFSRLMRGLNTGKTIIKIND